MRKIRIGTRRSDLALKQTEMVVNAIKHKFPNVETEIVVKVTQGDKSLAPISSFGGKGVFVEEFQDALLMGDIDIAVHCAKDMPMKIPDGLSILGVLPRGDVRDVLVYLRGVLVQKGGSLSKFYGDSIYVGTSSPRRKMQFERLLSCKCTLLRGNVPTRISKLRDGEVDCIILAAAGLKRLSLDNEGDLEYRYFSASDVVPAGGQAIIAVEGRKDDSEIKEIISAINDEKTMAELTAERYLLSLLGFGCSEPVGVYCQISGTVEDGTMSVTGIIERDGFPHKVIKTGDAASWSYLCDIVFERLTGRK